MNQCVTCGASLSPGATRCIKCGTVISSPVTQEQPQNRYSQQQSVTKPHKNKVAAGLLGIFLGGIGVHKFYLGQIGLGIVYLVFFWTGIPALIGFIEGIVYLAMSDEAFVLKYG
jgi:hypothetical protein